MAGIYIHVPFCRQACRYCDFYFTVSLRYREAYVDALLREVHMRKDYLQGDTIQTIYFGGGTPSILEVTQLSEILGSLYKTFAISGHPEITLEANPDDLTKSYLEGARSAGINRLSVGIQSFHQGDLVLMHRSHNADQAAKSILEAKKAGFNNMNLDLIYGSPGLTTEGWKRNIERVIQLPVSHVSAYHLTYEPGTVFHHWRKKGRLKETEESVSIEQFELLRTEMATHGFTHYEISNFAKDGYLSRHNTSYWKGETYLGLGPAAHSFNGAERRWNVASVKKYCEAIDDGRQFYEREILSAKDHFNEYIMISLRTMWGLDLDYIINEFGEVMYGLLLESAERHIRDGNIILEGGKMLLSKEQWIRADMLIRDLIVS